MTVALWGKDHVTLDEVAVTEAARGVAVAISRGRHRKAYAYTHPNEDAAVAVVGPRATLLVVADGHNGWPATEAAVRTVLECFGDDPPPADVSDDAVVALFHDAGEAILAETGAPGHPHPDSRTTLVVALVAGRRLQWASFGDSAVYAVTPAAATSLAARDLRFVGYPMPRHVVGRLLRRGTTELGPSEWVVVASDGFVDFAHPFPTGLFIGDADARVVAGGLVEAACAGGAGDNVAVAVAGPPG